MPPKKRQLVKATAAAAKKVQKTTAKATDRQIPLESESESPRAKRQRSRAVPDLLQVPFESPNASRASRASRASQASRDLSKNQHEEEQQRSRSSEEGTEDAEAAEPSNEQRGESRGSAMPQVRVSEAREGRTKAVHDLPARTEETTEATTQATTEATTEATAEDQFVEAIEQEVELADEVTPCIKTDLPDLSQMKMWMEYNNAFATKKVTVRSSLHSKLDKFRKALHHFNLMDRFKESCFGHLIDLPKCVFAPKLVHNILLRRVICQKKFEAWFKFHELPLRFGMQEFALMTRLSCALPPPDDFMDEARSKGKDLWDLVSRKGKKAASSDYILELIESEDLVTDDDIRFSLCLCWFEHQVLCSKDTNSGIEEWVVCLASTPEYFYKYPWGRKSFDLTVFYILKDFTSWKAPENSYTLCGFPWAFMAWVLEAIPALRLREYPKEKTIPRMKRWLGDKVEKDLDAVFQHVDIQEVHPYLVPTPKELRDVLHDFVPFEDVEDMVIDGLMRELDGVTMLRKQAVVPNTPLEHVVLSRGAMLTGYSGGKGADLFGASGREYTGIAGDLFGYARRKDEGRGGVIGREEDGSSRGPARRKEDGGSTRGVVVRREEAVVGTSTGECTCKCLKCKEDTDKLLLKVGGIETMLVEMKEIMKTQVPKRVGLRSIFPSRVMKSPFTASGRKGKKKTVRGKIDIYKPVDKKSKDALDAFLAEKKNEKSPLFLGHEYNYKDLEEIIRMENSLKEKHVEEIMSLMRLKKNAHSQFYLKSDVILDLNFSKKLCELYKKQRVLADALAAPLEVQLETVQFKDDMLDYAQGKQPNPGGVEWAGVKRIFCVMKLKGVHFVTVEFLVEEGKIRVYNSMYSDNINDDEFDTLMKPITSLFPIFIRQCEMFQNLPEDILNIKVWPYERVKDLPTSTTRTASGAYALAFIEHLLTKTPWDKLCDSTLVDFRMKWAVDIFRGKMVP